MTSFAFYPDDFDRDHIENRTRATFARRAAEIAVMARAPACGHITDPLDAVRLPAVLLDLYGAVVRVNAAAEALFDEDVSVRQRRLCVRDVEARARLRACVEQLEHGAARPPSSDDPIVVARQERLPVLIRVWPLEASCRWPSPDVRALLTLAPLGPRPGPPPASLARIFSLTPSESKLASIIARGAGPDVAALELNISRETARNQLKSIFAKTATHRQGELVALLLQV